MRNTIIPSLFTFLLALSVVSCGSNNNADATSDTVVANASPAAGSCLLDYADKLDQLLTTTEAANYASKPVNESEVQYNKIMKNTAYHDCQYKWKPSGRITIINGLEIPQSDIISIGCIAPMDMQVFQRDYTVKTKTQTDAMEQQMDEQMDKALDKKSGNDNVDEAVDKLEEKGVSKKTTKTVTGAIGSAFAQVMQAYTPVDGLADAASWNTHTNTLYVLGGGAKFEVGVNVNDDTNVNKELAIRIAKDMLAKCN